MIGREVLPRLLIVFLVFVILLSFSQAVFAQTPISDVPKSVVRVAVFRADTEVPRSELVTIGSGFVVDDQEPSEYVVTNLHVADWYLYHGIEAPFPMDIYVYRSRDHLLPATLHLDLPRVDMALLKLDPQHLAHGYDTLELASRDMVEHGDQTFAIGFPIDAGLGFPLLEYDYGLADFPAAYPEDATITQGIISKKMPVEGVGYYQMDASVNQGSSGGPLVNEHGQVIGVVTRTEPFAEGIHGAFQIDYLIDVLKTAGIPFKEAGVVVDTDVEPEDPPVDEDEVTDIVYPPPVNGEGPFGMTNQALFLIIGAAALLIVVLIVILAMRRRATTPAMATPSMPSPQQVTAASGPITRARPEGAPAVTQAKRKEPRPVIKGVSGHFSGQTLELVENQMIVGRDPRLAQLVYPQNREEISRKHLTIRFDERTHKFTLVDSSSNGTFLSSNQKLEPGETYYLNSGDRFYLADPNEAFEVKVES